MSELHTGDCLGIVRRMEDASVDSVVTDPPYGLGFMGKDWDRALPDPEIWSELLRVAKPGAHLIAFGHPRLYHRLACHVEDAGWELRDCLMWLYGTGFPKSLDVRKAIDKAAGAEQWEGWGTALKPAYEPVILARKPLIGTVAANVLAHGTGALNIDGCRIDGPPSAGGNSSGATALGQGSGWNAHANRSTEIDRSMAAGRWPANLILDEEAGALLDEQSGDRSSPWVGNGKGNTVGQKGGLTDSGGASRFFYCAKPSRRERTHGGTIENKHPTVKPIALMRWLVRLVTPPGGLVLDPFMGSGSTGVAALDEGFEFVGIERDPETVAVAEARMEQGPRRRDAP